MKVHIKQRNLSLSHLFLIRTDPQPETYIIEALFVLCSFRILQLRDLTQPSLAQSRPNTALATAITSLFDTEEASMADVVVKAAICVAAVDWYFRPASYKTYGDVAAERTGRAYKLISEHETTRAVAGGVRSILSRLPERIRPFSPEPLEQQEGHGERDAAIGASAAAFPSSSSDPEPSTPDTSKASSPGFSSESSDSTPATPASPDSTSSESSDDHDIAPHTPIWPYSFPDEASPDRHFHEPEILYGPWDPEQRPRISKAELNKILQAILEHRTHRHEAMQRRAQRNHAGILATTPESEKKKGKKTVRFAIGTKPGSMENSSNAGEDKLLSPLPPSNSELALLTTALAVPDGSLFTHPYDFDEAALIRKLPSQMKNGAGGLAYCRGRTENGLYMLDSPAGRMLLDLRAGVCYDGRDGRMMGSEETMRWMLWGRGAVEEKWGGFRWNRGLDEGVKT